MASGIEKWRITMSELRLIETIKTENLAAARDLIESGEEVNQQDEHGWTPLNWAAGKGNLDLVKLLVDLGADIFKVGRDQRTPYMIALAAGRTEVAKYLRQLEDQTAGEKQGRPEREYCKAYHISDFRKFSRWTESKINWKENGAADVTGNGGEGEQSLADDDIAFLHHDYTVTASMWRNENIIFNHVTSEWKEFCSTILQFKAPDDLDLIVSAQSAA
jgi:uncharacterized protein